MVDDDDFRLFDNFSSTSREMEYHAQKRYKHHRSQQPISEPDRETSRGYVIKLLSPAEKENIQKVRIISANVWSDPGISFHSSSETFCKLDCFRPAKVLRLILNHHESQKSQSVLQIQTYKMLS